MWDMDGRNQEMVTENTNMGLERDWVQVKGDMERRKPDGKHGSENGVKPGRKQVMTRDGGW